MKLPKQTVGRNSRDGKLPKVPTGVSPQGGCEIACNIAHAGCLAAGIPPIVCNAGLAACLGLC